MRDAVARARSSTADRVEFLLDLVNDEVEETRRNQLNEIGNTCCVSDDGTDFP
jgi:hypothetical protein